MRRRVRPSSTAPHHTTGPGLRINAGDGTREPSAASAPARGEGCAEPQSSRILCNSRSLTVACRPRTSIAVVTDLPATNSSGASKIAPMLRRRFASQSRGSMIAAVSHTPSTNPMREVRRYKSSVSSSSSCVAAR